ncbi:hypothetical protein RCL1_005953 [Eukaryota sp. TZLM3-RCL]
MEIVFALYFLTIIRALSAGDQPPAPEDILNYPITESLPWTVGCLDFSSGQPRLGCTLLSFAPADNQLAIDIANQLKLSAALDEDPVAFINENIMQEVFSNDPLNNMFAFIIHPSDENTLNYTLRVQNHLFNPLGGPNDINFATSFLMSFQSDLVSAILKVTENKDVQVQINHKFFPTHKQPYPMNQAVIILPFYLAMGTLLMATTVVSAIVSEKEKQLKQTLRCNGMKLSAYWLSNLVQWATIAILVAIIWTVACVVFNIVERNVVIVFVLAYFFFICTLVALLFVLSSFFSNVKTALGLVTLFHMLLSFTALSAFFLVYMDLGKFSWIRTVSRFIPHANFAQIVVLLLNSGDAEVGSFWSFSIAYSEPIWKLCVYLGLNFIGLFGLTIYLDNVLPTEFDCSKSFFYIFSLKYWKQVFSKDSDYTQVPRDVPALQFKNLVKKFKLPKNEIAERKKAGNNDHYCVAVDDMSAVIPFGTTFAILGKNGAGKTTAVLNAVGALKPTSGDVAVAGFSVTTDIDQVRRIISFVPQKDVLYDLLSVKEHIILWGCIKGLKPEASIAAGNDLLKSVHLHNDAEKRSNELSGGMKRKLCLCCSFVGDPLVVFLDEVSTGIDAHSRQQIWELLSKKKSSSQVCIVLITHYIEEAQVLADDVSIMASAKVRARGSPMELALKHGANYTFSFAKGDSFNENRVVSVIKQHVSKYDILANSSHEMIVSIPSSFRPVFKQLLSVFDQEKSDLGILSYGVQISTLEDIYLDIVAKYQAESLGEM